MAITHRYCDYAAGNDFHGASFTDGAWTNATLTLVKNGAFTNHRAGHRIYLTDNGSGAVTPGIYTLATVPDANTVTLTASCTGGADAVDVKCTQCTGAIDDPYNTVQGALDVARDAVNGDQINVKSTTAQVLAASLSFTVYGTPAQGEPLLIRGYTTTANDGGVGEIDCGGATMFAATNVPYIHLVDLECHTFGDNNGISWSAGGNHMAVRCEIHKGASAPSSKTLLNFATAGCYVIGCYVHDAGSSGTGISNSGPVLYCYVADCATGINAPGYAIGNVVNVPVNGTGINCTTATQGIVIGNTVYTSSSTGTGIVMGAETSNRYETALNNIVIGFSGAGGKGIAATNDMHVLGHNAFYNNTANYSLGDVTYVDMTANDVALAADPFTDAANGDFSLTAAGKTALRGLGWPGAYLGANAATDGHVTIGAVQYGEAEAGGGVYNRVMRLLGG